jgi:hypothetical protein
MWSTLRSTGTWHDGKESVISQDSGDAVVVVKDPHCRDQGDAMQEIKGRWRGGERLLGRGF